MSKKIVRAFEVKEAIKPSTSVKPPYLFKSLLEAPAADPTADERGLKTDGETNIQHVLGNIFEIPTDSFRGILFLNDSDLKNRYLIQNGPAKFAEALPDNLFNIRNRDGVPDWFKLAAHGRFDLSDVTVKEATTKPFAVLFNIKKATWDKFSKAASVEEKRAAFVECISHRFYVAVLNVDQIKRANVGSLNDMEEREQKFNIVKFITAYHTRSVIDAAREEFEARAKGAAGANSAAQEEAIKTVVERAVRFVIKSFKNGKLKGASKTKFESALHKLLYEAPEFQGREELVPLATKELIHHPSVDRLQNELAFLGVRDATSTSDAGDNNSGQVAPGKQQKSTTIDIGDDEHRLSAQDLYKKLEGNPVLARHLAKMLTDNPI